MYIYYDRNKVLREIINDEAIVEGLNRNKIYIYYELQGDNVLTFNSGKFIKPDDSEVDILSNDVTTISDLTSNAAKIPYNPDRDLKYFKYGKGYPFTVITVNNSVYTEDGVVLGSVTVTVDGYSAETLERFTFMVEANAGIEFAEPMDESMFEYLVKLFANKNVFAVRSLPVTQDDINKYEVDDLLINLNTKKLYIITGDPKAPSEWLDLSDLATNADLLTGLTTKVDKLTTSGVFAYIHNGNVQDELAVSTPATGDTIAKRENDGRLKVATPTSSGDATTKDYVDTQRDTRVAKTSNGYKVYGTDMSGNQVQMSYDEDTDGLFVRRDSAGHIYVQNPNANGQATPKQYVDNLVAPKADKTYVDSNFAHTLDLSIDSNYDLVVKILNANGVVISQDDVDLPLESIVVSATYYDTYTYQGVTYNKVIVIVLATTSVPTIVPVGDLVSGLVSSDELTTALSDYYTKTQADNKFVEQVSGKGLSSNDFTDAYKSKLDGIESGAEVNVLEGVQVDGVDIPIVGKKVNITNKQDNLGLSIVDGKIYITFVE